MPTTPARRDGTRTSNLPLEQRFDERILERAKERMRELDRNGNGTLEGEELANYRGDPPILMSDLNKDNNINLEEMAPALSVPLRRLFLRRPGGPGGYPGSPGGPFRQRLSRQQLIEQLSYRPPYPSSIASDHTTTHRPHAPPSPRASSSSSSSSSGDRIREFAERIFRSNDRNNSGKLEKDEWGSMRDPESTDANRDGVITSRKWPPACPAA